MISCDIQTPNMGSTDVVYEKLDERVCRLYQIK